MMGGLAAASIRWSLKPGVYQRHVGRAGHQQRHGERELDSLAGDLEDRSHGREHPAILAEESRGFFFAGFTSRLRLRDGLDVQQNGPKWPFFDLTRSEAGQHGSQK